MEQQHHAIVVRVPELTMTFLDQEGLSILSAPEEVYATSDGIYVLPTL